MQGKAKGQKKEKNRQDNMKLDIFKKENNKQDGLKMGKKRQNGFKKKRQDSDDMKKDMDLILSDPRFAHVASDLRLRHVPKEERRVKLDSRFQSVLTDDKFYEKSTMDPRGRKGNYSTKEDLLKFYQISSSEEDSDDDEDEEEEEEAEEGEEEEKEAKWNVCDEDGVDGNNLEKSAAGSTVDDKSNQHETNEMGHKNLSPEQCEMEDVVGVSEEVLKRVENMSQDYARGEVLFSDDSSDDDSSSDEEDEENVPEFEWGELDQDAVWDNEQDVEETSRFAVCNLDWDRIKAADIMILFTSFCPRGGSVTQVTIYPSEYGKQRMAEEEVKGPQELRRTGKNYTDPDLVDLEKLEKGKLDQSAGATKGDYEALRRYQRNRLRYYYAVVECDSVDTARTVYSECDRKPYEGAGFLLDLRYIPSDMTFDEMPHDVCQKIPESYEVKSFTTTALHDSRPVLTWDETDPERQKALSSAMTQAMKGSQIEDDCLRNLIASSSDEEHEDVPVNSEGSESESDDDDVAKASRIAKFRALISEIDEKEKRKQEREKDLEEAFDLKDKDYSESDEDEDDKKVLEETEETCKSKDDKTPFEKYLEKRKTKRRTRIERKKMEKKKAQDDSSEGTDYESEDQLISDDELPEDAGDICNDPFFAEELTKMKHSTKKNKKSKSKSGAQKDDNDSIDDVNAKDQDNLELLLMDEDAKDKKHFSMREIIESNKEKKKKRRKKKLKKKEKSLPQNQESKNDDFKVNISDPRFSSLLTSGDYNIDPSHPQFKHTQAMDSLIDEMQRKRVAESFEEVPDSKRSRVEGRSKLELSALVKKVKSKAKRPSVRQ